MKSNQKEKKGFTFEVTRSLLDRVAVCRSMIFLASVVCSQKHFLSSRVEISDVRGLFC